MTILDEANEIAEQFEISDEMIERGVKEFCRQMKLGLEYEGQAMTMIPTYVTAVPTGKEVGTYLAVDLGGTNFRVCAVTLNGNRKFDIEQKKYPIEGKLMTAKEPEELFGFLAEKIKDFVDQREKPADHFKMGFTFSFPVKQTALNKGTLLRWTKGFDITSAIGQDVCELLQKELDARKVPVRVSALVNDTVGTLMAACYSGEGDGGLLGAIFGTGTNGAYCEQMDNIRKLPGDKKGMMVVNTEWGSFDNDLKVIGDTAFDQALDALSPNPGNQMFEKRVSGMFLGEVLRQVLLTLSTHAAGTGGGDLFAGQTSAALNKPWSLDTSVLSKIEQDTSDDLIGVQNVIHEHLKLDTSSLVERQAIKTIVEAIGRRSARLAGVALASIVVNSGEYPPTENISIGVDGSVVEFYPGYEKLMREAMRVVLGDAEKSVQIATARDGSGVGAALCALSSTL